MSSNVVVTHVILSLLCSHVVICQEPSCTKFTFLEQLLEKVVRIEMRMENYQSQLDLITQIQEDVKKIAPQPTSSSSTKVAFFATMETKRVTYNTNDVVKFENVITNIANAYDLSTGVFRAPVDGTYFFQATILSDNDAELWASLISNGGYKSELNAKGHGGRHGTGTNTLLVTLQKNDEVKVMNRGVGAKYYGESYAVFTGYLLF